ncbi:MAG: hypothetical protein ACI9W1_002791, partial [Candidatus Azotimanducaceae bacterium]
VKDCTLYVQAGAGVVADSIPRLEWKETINKARSIMQAAAMAERGLQLTSGQPSAGQPSATSNSRQMNSAESRPVVDH